LGGSDFYFYSLFVDIKFTFIKYETISITVHISKEMMKKTISNLPLQVKGVNFSYGKKNVLRNITFSVPHASICGLLGPNGSGKTTLLGCISGIKKLESGSIFLHGKAVQMMTRKEIAREVSVVPQQTGFIFPFKVLDMVLMGKAPVKEIWETPSLADREEALGVLERLGIRELSGRTFQQISGGEKQMVLIARSLLQNTDIMLLDEPTSHLDMKNQILILDLIKKVSYENRITVLMTLHDPNLALHYCDQIILLKNGQIMSQGNTSEVMQSQKLSNVYGIEVELGITSKGTRVVVPSCWR